MVHYIGLHLGPPGEYHALVMLERSVRATAEACPQPAWFYAVRRLERYAPETPHHAVLKNVVALLDPPPPGDSYLVINQTNVGRPVVDAYRRADLPAAVRRVLLTNGAERGYDGGVYRVPLRELISVLQQVLQERRLRAEGQLSLAATLAEQLGTFQPRRPSLREETLDQWRERERDDLVFAVGLAVWMAERERAAFPEVEPLAPGVVGRWAGLGANMVSSDKHYIAGLDLGQAQEFTAVAVLEKTTSPDPDVPERKVNRYAVRHLERFPPGTPYSQVGCRLAGLFAGPPLAGSTLVVDQTVVGRPALTLLRRSRIPARIRHVTVTGGHKASADGRGGWLVPKRELVGTLQVLLQARRITIASTLPEAPTLVQELMSFRVKATSSTGETLDAWREGPHDDLVLAVAIAAWEGEHYRELQMWIV